MPSTTEQELQDLIDQVRQKPRMGGSLCPTTELLLEAGDMLRYPDSLGRWNDRQKSIDMNAQMLRDELAR